MAAAPGRKKPDTERLLEAVTFQSEVVAAGIDPRSTMQRATDAALAITGASGAVIELAEGTEMVYRVVAGSLRESLGMRLQLSGSLSGLTVLTGQMQICEDSEADPRVDRAACRKVGSRSMVCVPLVHDGITVGVLEAASAAVAAFDSTDVQVLRALGGAIAGAMAQAKLLESLDALSRTDPMTGLLNRLGFTAEAERRLDLCRRRSIGSATVMLDLDNFRDYNERLGQSAGDHFLSECATKWPQALRAHDLLGRWGGATFVLLLTDCPASHALVVCDRMRAVTPEEQTFSAGVAVAENGASLRGLVARADRALLAAKTAGRNRSIVDTEAEAA